MAAVKNHSFRNKVSQLLVRSFPDARISIDEAKPSKKLSGIVVWPGFDGLEQVDRQSRLWKVLRSKLSPEEQLKITAILTMTPAER